MAAVAPNKGLLVENFHTDISAGVPFIVDVNFVFEIKSTQMRFQLQMTSHYMDKLIIILILILHRQCLILIGQIIMCQNV